MPGKRRRLVAVKGPRVDARSVPGRKRRGRPLGSPSLTKGVEDTIVSYLLSGATYAAAAAAAGVSPRTLREWIERGEGRHATRACTPKLRRFAKRVRQARGQARVLAENRVYERYPRAWLARAARAATDDEGWSDAPAKGGQPGPFGLEIAALSEEQIDHALERVGEVIMGRSRKSRSTAPRRRRKASA